MISDCFGDVRYTSGAPEQGQGFADFRVTAVEIPAGVLEAGMDFIVFLTHIKYVDYNMSHGIEQFAANSFAVELSVRTSGSPGEGRTCPSPAVKAPYLWLAKTLPEKGMVPWPTFEQ